MGTQRKCLYCGIELQFQRRTRKYCSDNCKQLAYYQRKGISMSGISEEKEMLTVKENDVIVKKTQNENHNDFTVNDNRKSSLIQIPNINEKENCAEELTVKENLQEQNKKNISQQNEKEFQWIESRFMELLMHHIDNERKGGFKFLFPEDYWHKGDIPYIKWVTLRARCLIDCVIRLSECRQIDEQTLFDIADAFHQLVSCKYFQAMPENYPNKKLVTELNEKIQMLSEENRESEKICFRISPDKKAELIAVRFHIGKFVPKIKFSELEFETTII